MHTKCDKQDWKTARFSFSKQLIEFRHNKSGLASLSPRFTEGSQYTCPAKPIGYRMLLQNNIREDSGKQEKNNEMG